MNITVGTVVRSKAGKDKGAFLAVIGTSGDRVLVADGKSRKVENPKPKNPAHLAPTKTVFELPLSNKELKRRLKEFAAVTKED